ncbi:hypothetical protein BLNAU_9526 [Blattamonas nauphoetae]|uniref:Uncharacterized protein n=1 Tax=Blattamonas nauphoetae TaxID=2049346 RepID=A0ABQ9XVH4_9EUKA|nr:hypothetical protein BLNAU_9526 [Blattamonas nauphoetae]
MQYSPTKQIVAPLSPTNRQAKTRRMRQVQLPECPEDVIGNLHRYPLLVWYDPTTSNDSEDSLLNDDRSKTLRSLVASKCETGEELKWMDLMEWFVCAVIGLNSKGFCCNNSFWFDWDDVVVDGFGTARINLSASRSDSFPPNSPQSLSNAIADLSLLFLVLIDQLSQSNCLPKRLELHSRINVISTVLRHLLSQVVGTDHLDLACDPSDFEEIVNTCANKFINSIPSHLSLNEHLICMTMDFASALNDLSNLDSENHTDQLADTENDHHSPSLTHFLQLLDPDLFEEAKRISSWKEFLQKVAGGEEVEVCLLFVDFDFQNDTSFLKLPFFQPTLLSLQAKFQQLASSLDESADSSTSSLISLHSSPHTSLETHLDSSLRTLSSSSHLKQESLQLLAILHSLLSSPLPPSHSKDSSPDISDWSYPSFHQKDVSPTEKFGPDIFDVSENEDLTLSLIRCHSVCNLVGAESCIHDLPVFFDRTVSVLHTSNSLIRTAAFSLFEDLVDMSSVIPLYPRLWYRLRTAFRDGRLEEQDALLRISSNWIGRLSLVPSLPPFLATEFDWAGLISADLRNDYSFFYSIVLIMFLRHPSIEDKIEKAVFTRIILSFEQHQHAVN